MYLRVCTLRSFVFPARCGVRSDTVLCWGGDTVLRYGLIKHCMRRSGSTVLDDQKALCQVVIGRFLILLLFFCGKESIAFLGGKHCFLRRKT